MHGFQLNLCVLLKWYHVKENTYKKDRYMLNALHRKKIFSKTSSGDKNGKKMYVFVSGDCGDFVGENMRPIRTEWNFDFAKMS